MSLTNTTFLLMAEFSAPVIRLADISERYLALNPENAKKMALRGELDLPVFRLTDSRKAPLMVHIEDLAALIDRRQENARAEHQKINSIGVSPRDEAQYIGQTDSSPGVQ
ncbi:MAG: pyocin activator PrtN family protein [Gammaproteobacteria bacterium]